MEEWQKDYAKAFCRVHGLWNDVQIEREYSGSGRFYGRYRIVANGVNRSTDRYTRKELVRMTANLNARCT